MSLAETLFVLFVAGFWGVTVQVVVTAMDDVALLLFRICLLSAYLLVIIATFAIHLFSTQHVNYLAIFMMMTTRRSSVSA